MNEFIKKLEKSLQSHIVREFLQNKYLYSIVEKIMNKYNGKITKLCIFEFLAMVFATGTLYIWILDNQYLKTINRISKKIRIYYLNIIYLPNKYVFTHTNMSQYDKLIFFIKCNLLKYSFQMSEFINKIDCIVNYTNLIYSSHVKKLNFGNNRKTIILNEINDIILNKYNYISIINNINTDCVIICYN